jgi:hypothetical protein
MSAPRPRTPPRRIKSSNKICLRRRDASERNQITLTADAADIAEKPDNGSFERQRGLRQ